MEVTISQFALDDYYVSGSTAYLRFYSNSQWTDAEGDEHLPDETTNGTNFYKEIPLVVNTSTHRIDETSFSITSTEDAIQNAFARYAIKLLDANRREIAFVGDFYVPSSLGASITWAQLVLANRAQLPWRDITTYTKTETNQQIAQQIANVVTPDASTSVKGMTRLSVAPVSASTPIAVGDNDRRVPDIYNVKSYGADPDTASDDTAAIQAAIAAVPAYGELVFPPPSSSSGSYKLSSTLLITKPIALRGLGGIFPFDENNDPSLGPPYYNISPARTAGIKFLWAGGASDMVKVYDTEGVTFDNLIFDGAELATFVLKLDTARHCTFRQCAFVRPAAAGAAAIIGTSYPSSGGNNNNGARFNNFYNCLFYGTNGVQIKKIDSGGSGGYHNDFYSCRIKFEGAAGVGLHIVNGDNNAFVNLISRIYNGASTYGVRIGSCVTFPGGASLEPQGAYNNYFYHLQAERVWVDNDCPYAGAVYGLDLANMTGLPVIGTNSKLTYTIEGFVGAADQGKNGLNTSANVNVGGALTTLGGIATAHKSITSSVTITPSDAHLFLIGADAGPITITLPSAITWNQYEVIIKKADATANAVTVSGAIDGGLSYSLPTFGKSVTLKAHSSGTWFITASH